MVKNKFAALFCTALAAVMLAACGGPSPVAQKSAVGQQEVNIEASSSAIVIGDAASLSISGTGATVGAVGPFTLTYTATTGKFTGKLSLAADTYTLTATALNASSAVIGTGTVNNVVVTASAVANVAINIGSITDALPADGFVITGFTASTGVIPNDGTSQATFAVTAAYAGTAPTYAWTKSTGCAGVYVGAVNTASAVFQSSATQEVCTLTVTVTAAGNANFKATRTATLGIGMNTSVTGLFVPAPTVTAVSLITDGGYTGLWKHLVGSHGEDLGYTPERIVETSCSLTRTGTGASAASTCPGAYKINSAVGEPAPTWDGTPPEPVITLSATEMTIGVTYDLGGIYDATKPPELGLTASCPNAATNGVSHYDFNATPAHSMIGSGPGTAACPAAPAPCTGSAFLFWTEPSAFNVGTGDVCTLTITVKNQGASDSFPLKVFITQ